MEKNTFEARVHHRDRFRFDIVFDDECWSPIVVDEPEPLGAGAGPNAARLLAAAVGNCLAASLLLCTEKARVPLSDIRASVTGSMVRNEEGRLRIGGMDVVVAPTLDGELSSGRFERCLEIFEDFCIVTQSVREGIEVDVRVEPRVAGGDRQQDEGDLVGAVADG